MCSLSCLAEMPSTVIILLVQGDIIAIVCMGTIGFEKFDQGRTVLDHVRINSRNEPRTSYVYRYTTFRSGRAQLCKLPFGGPGHFIVDAFLDG